jgi:hypothetical protein
VFIFRQQARGHDANFADAKWLISLEVSMEQGVFQLDHGAVGRGQNRPSRRLRDH